MKKSYKKSKFHNLIVYSTHWQNLILIIISVVLIGSLSVGYALIQQEFGIEGEAIVRGNASMRVSSIELLSTTNGAYERYNSKYLESSLITGIVLPNLNSTITYQSSITNNSGVTMEVSSIVSDSWSNSNVEYVLDGLLENQVIEDGDSITFTVLFKYKSSVTVLPQDTTLESQIGFRFSEYVFVEKPYIDEFNTCDNFTGRNMNYSCSNGILTLTSTTDDPQMKYHLDSNDSFNPNKFKYAIVKYRVVNSISGFMQFFMVENPVDATYSVTQNIPSDYNWRRVVIDLTTNNSIKALDSITGFRFDPVNKSGMTIEIDYVSFVDSSDIQYAYYEDFNSWNNYPNSNLNYSVNPVQSYASLTSTTDDPILKIQLNQSQYFDLKKYRYIYVRYKSSSTNLGRMEFFINEQNPAYSIYTTTLVGNNAWNEAIIDMGQSQSITSLGTMKFFRFDFTSVKNVTMLIDYIKFSDVLVY